MKIVRRLSFCAAVLMAASAVDAQTQLNSTTLSIALTGTGSSSTPGDSTELISLASCSNLLQNSIGQYVTAFYVDFEAMDMVQEVSSSPCVVRVVRGAFGTLASKHNSGALTYIGQPNWFGGSAYGGAALVGDKLGACTAVNELYLPYINVNDGKIFQCLSGGQWVQVGFGTMGTPPSQPIGNFCTGTAGSAQTEYLNSAACSGATTLTATRVITSPGTLWGLQAYSSAAVTGGSSKDVITVYKNGSATAITCTMAASGTTCSDLTHSVATAVGDVIAFQFVSATSDTAANVSASIEKQ